MHITICPDMNGVLSLIALRVSKYRRSDMKRSLHNIDVMDWNPGRVKLGVRSTSVLIVLEPKIIDILLLLTGPFGCVHRNQDRFG